MRSGLVNGRWRLLRVEGQGADATVWRARDERDGAEVALKALARLDEVAKERLRWEFAVLCTINHPHLISVYDLDQAAGGGPLPEGQPFYTSELCLGESPLGYFGTLPAAARATALCQL